MTSAAQGHEVEGTVPSQWWLDLKVENQRLREALTYYAEGRYPDGGEIARKALFDKSGCTNGPDENGDWPCDPQVLFGGQEAECQTCGRVAAWPKEEG